MDNFSQINFEFNADQVTEAPVNVRIKNIKLKRPEPQNIRKQDRSKRGRKPLKEVGSEAFNINIPSDEVLFRKQYYTIGDVAEMFNVNTSQIRTWENEFDIIEPRKNRKGDRYFRPVDIKNLLLIHHLIRQRKFTLEGAKEYMKNHKKVIEKFEMIESLQKIKSFLLEIRANL